jgi:hypothetical protein
MHAPEVAGGRLGASLSDVLGSCAETVEPVVVPLADGEPDDVRRLRLIAAETSKRKHCPQGGTLSATSRAGAAHGRSPAGVLGLGVPLQVSGR